MSSNVRNLVLSVFSLGVLVAIWFVPGWRFERALKRAAYDRYASVGDADLVKRIVDKSHAEIFDDCFVEGLPKRAKNFDVNKYRHLLDQRVEKELGQAYAAKLATLEGPAKVPAPASRPTPPAPSPTPNVHRVEIVGMQVKPATATEAEAGIVGKLFEVQIDVQDERQDISFRETPDIDLAVRCPGGETFSTQSPRIEEMPTEPDGVTHVKLRLLVPESTAGTGNGLCELGVRIKDKAGNASEESKRFVALR